MPDQEENAAVQMGLSGADQRFAATDTDLLRIISRHGTPTLHRAVNGGSCLCWSEAERVLRDLRGAGYAVVKEQPDA